MRRIEALVAKADDALRVLLMKTPSWMRDQSPTPSARTSYVVRDGSVVEGRGSLTERAALTNWREGNVDPDSLARHRAQLRRLQFRGPQRLEAPPSGPVWDRD